MWQQTLKMLVATHPFFHLIFLHLTCSQFHQHFNEYLFQTKITRATFFLFEVRLHTFLAHQNWHEKTAHKMLVKLTRGWVHISAFFPAKDWVTSKVRYDLSNDGTLLIAFFTSNYLFLRTCVICCTHNWEWVQSSK